MLVLPFPLALIRLVLILHLLPAIALGLLRLGMVFILIISVHLLVGLPLLLVVLANIELLPPLLHFFLVLGHIVIDHSFEFVLLRL